MTMSHSTQTVIGHPEPPVAEAPRGPHERMEEPGARPVLSLSNLRVTFERDGHRIHAVNGLSYQIFSGQTLAVVGESGSGKSVSSRALLGLLPGYARVSGSAVLDGVELIGMPERRMRKIRGAGIGMVFQDPARSLNPTMRVGEQIAEAIRCHEKLDRVSEKERAIELMRMVRIPAPEHRFFEYPGQLSGGMRQRVVIAIALAGRPKVLIADEATTALDVTTQAQIMDLLCELQDSHAMALILITHDLALAASYAKDIVVMYAGRAVESAPASELFRRMRMPYTQALLRAIPRLDADPHRLLPVAPGQPPDLRVLPTGCSFRSRCEYADERCNEQPPYAEHEPGHAWACWHPLDAARSGVKE